MESSTAVAAFQSVLGSSVKLADKGFEICAVDERAKILLQTVQQVAGQLDGARLLRRQKSGQFAIIEKRMFDDTFRHCEEALRHVALLAERSTAESGGLTNNLPVFILRDSPSINVSLTQLGIASQSLDATIMQLNSRYGRPSSSAGSPPTQSPRKDELKRSPTYEESQFLSAGRQRNMARRASAMGITNAAPINPPPQQPPQSSRRHQHIQSDRTRTLSSSALYIPPSIPELVGDDVFPRPVRHTTLPIITVAGAYTPCSDPIVIETEPVVSSPPRSASALSQSSSSSPRSPPARRQNSVSSRSSDGAQQQPSTFTPPQSTGVQTPPNAWSPQFQEPRPPPASSFPQQPVVMPVPPGNPSTSQITTLHQSPANMSPQQVPPPSIPSSNYVSAQPPSFYTPPANIHPLPPQHMGRRTSPMNSWNSQQFQEYRPPSAGYTPAPNVGIGIRTSTNLSAQDPGFAPYSPNFPGPMGADASSDPQYVYTPSMAKRGHGGRHRSHSWLDARAQ